MASHGVCVRCSVGITSRRDLVRLDPCGCTVCHDCLSEMEADRGVKQLKCSSCTVVVKKHWWWRESKVKEGEERRSGRVRKKRKGGDGSVTDEKENAGNVIDDEEHLEEVSVAHKYDLHPNIDAFRIWLTDMMRLSPEAREDIAGEGGLLVNQMYTVNFGDEKKKKNRSEYTASTVTVDRLSFVMSANGDSLSSEENRNGLIDSFCWLHSAIMPISFTPEPDDDDDGMLPALRTPKALLEYKVNEECRDLFHALFGLATGKRDVSKIDVKDPDHQRQVFATSVAMDALVRALHARKDLGHTTAMLSYQMDTASDTQQVELMSRLALTQARSTKYHGKATAALEAMKRRLLLDTHGICGLTLDNIQWMDGNGSYIEKTLMLHRVPPTTELSYHLNLSRERGDWKRFVDENDPAFVIKKVWAALPGDYNTKFEQIFTHLKVVIDSEGELLTEEECQRHNAPPYHYKLRDEQMGVPMLHRFATKDDLVRLGGQGVNGEPTTSQHGGNDDESSLAGEDRSWETIWKRNHFHLSPIIDLKFSNRATMFGLLDYGNRTTDGQMERYNAQLRPQPPTEEGPAAAPQTGGTIEGAFDGGQELDRDHLRGKVPISRDCFLFVGDQSPVERIGRILDNDVSSGENKYQRAIAVAGAFHYRMRTLGSANESNHDMAEWLVSPCYGKDGETPTPQNLSYFFNFSDPTIPEIQVNAVLVAVYKYVVWCMRKHGQVGVSPVSAYEWMRARATESPRAMNLLRLVHDWELVFMHRYCERSNNFDMHLSSMRLSLPLLTVTHSVSYVRNTFDFLRDMTVRWPDHVKQLVRDFCFTVKSETGENIAADLGHEKYVRLQRETTGKVAKRGHQLKIEHAAVTSLGHANQSDNRHAISNLSGKGPATCRRPDWTKDARSIRAFTQATLLLKDSKIFEPGLSLGEENDSVLLSSVSVGDPLDGTLLRLPAIGDECIKHYGTRYYIDTQHEVIRHEKDMGLVSVRGTSGSIKESIDRLQKRSTATIEKDVLDSGTKEEIYQEFTKLEPYLSRSQKDKIPRLTPTQLKSYSKKTLVKILVGIRKQAFLRRPEAKINLEKEARESEEGPGTSLSSRREALSHIHFSGQGCEAFNDSRYRELTEL